MQLYFDKVTEIRTKASPGLFVLQSANCQSAVQTVTDGGRNPIHSDSYKLPVWLTSELYKVRLDSLPAHLRQPIASLICNKSEIIFGCAWF